MSSDQSLREISCNTINEAYNTDSECRPLSVFHEYASIRDNFTRLSSSPLNSLAAVSTTEEVMEHQTVNKVNTKFSKRYYCCCVILIVAAVVLSVAALTCSSVALALKLNSSHSKDAFPDPPMGLEQFNPAASCSVIRLLYPYLPSGYYWVKSSAGSSALRVFCEMTFTCGDVVGGWRRLARLDFTNTSVPCPAGFLERSDSGFRSCGIASPGKACVSAFFSNFNLPFRRVCGSVIAFQFGLTDAFGNYGRGTMLTIDSNYVDGVSITYGKQPRKHIWTFAAAVSEFSNDSMASCFCINGDRESLQFVPSFVGDHYSCETGSRKRSFTSVFYSNDPLWDGLGCGPQNMCCSSQGRWFFRSFNLPVTDDVEMRVCSDEPRGFEDIAVRDVAIYVQ